MKSFIQLFLLLSITASLSAQNYDESKIPDYTLPDLLIDKNGGSVTSADQWEQRRRDEVLSLFQQQMYGGVPDFNYEMAYQSRPLDVGRATAYTQEEVIISISNDRGAIELNMLLTLPATSEKPVPVFLGLNFQGNQATNSNPNISVTDNYVIGSDQLGVIDNRATEQSRGSRASRWPVDLIVSEGYGLATINCGDIDPDFDDDFKNGIHSLLEQPPLADQWGTIAAWAWGLSRALDYLQEDERIDGRKVSVIGHSRLGKAALWAGASDQRFALVISNDSGCGGAALSRRRIGETVKAINTSFPHWFCKNFHLYNDKEDKLPLDQHMLMALMAPRPVYVASAVEDEWADPKGEYLSLYKAGPVFRLYQFKTLSAETPPAVDSPVATDRQGYHIRSGGHNLTPYDWQQFIKFAGSQW